MVAPIGRRGIHTRGEHVAELTIRGARQHNLRGLDLTVPHGTWVAVTGVSGSGKSSLVWDTVHAEGRRRYLEALAPRLAARLGALQRPEVDALVGLRPTLALAQRTRRASASERVVRLLDGWDLLKVLFARRGTQHCPVGGEALRSWTHDEIVRALSSLPEGARLTLEAPLSLGSDPVGVLREVQTQGFSRLRVDGELVRIESALARPPQGPVRVVVDRIKVRPDRSERVSDAVRTTLRAGAGQLVAVTEQGEQAFSDLLVSPALGPLPVLSPKRLDPVHPDGACATCGGSGRTEVGRCTACDGTRLSPLARAVRIEALSLGDALSRPLAEVCEALRALPAHEPTELAREELDRRLTLATELGLGHLELCRSGDQLAQGEVQRLRLVRHAGSPLGGVIYVLDEPGAGLHPSDVARVVPVVRGLVEGGATVFTVAHQPALVRAADTLLELGPGPGAHGGELLYQGGVSSLPADTPTGRWLSGTGPGWARERRASGAAVAVQATLHHGLTVEVSLPLGALVAVTGVSGAGKSTLLAGALSGAEAQPGVDRVLEITGLTAGRAARANPATYLKLWDLLRQLLGRTTEAQVRGLTASSFSLNKKGGRCEHCEGLGRMRTELEVLPDAWSDCEVCGGARFVEDVLAVRWKGLHAGQLLELSVEEAWRHLGGQPKLEAPLRTLVDVGLGYLTLGQGLDTLSGGEAGRLALARELARAARSQERVLYGLDEPTVGLHPQDVHHLTGVLHQLVEQGGSVWVCTHHQGLVAAADHVVVLGPGAGPDGGRVLAQGTPEEVVHSAPALATALAGGWA